MFSLIELNEFLQMHDCCFEILKHTTPVISTQDAATYFDINKAAPTFIMDTEQGLVAFIVSFKRGKIDFKTIKQVLGFAKFKMAAKEKVEEQTGYQTGVIPLIGHHLPCIFDSTLLENDYIYGGSGEELHTLKIAPADVFRLNHIIKTI